MQIEIKIKTAMPYFSFIDCIHVMKMGRLIPLIETAKQICRKNEESENIVVKINRDNNHVVLTKSVQKILESRWVVTQESQNVMFSIRCRLEVIYNIHNMQ